MSTSSVFKMMKESILDGLRRRCGQCGYSVPPVVDNGVLHIMCRGPESRGFRIEPARGNRGWEQYLRHVCKSVTAEEGVYELWCLNCLRVEKFSAETQHAAEPMPLVPAEEPTESFGDVKW